MKFAVNYYIQYQDISQVKSQTDIFRFPGFWSNPLEQALRNHVRAYVIYLKSQILQILYLTFS